METDVDEKAERQTVSSKRGMCKTMNGSTVRGITFSVIPFLFGHQIGGVLFQKVFVETEVTSSTNVEYQRTG
jgi:hypothetical protein